ncbi:MAG: RNA polymerase factor sigma-54 [Bacteroidales bacterium]|nr:RNA polymerase factor sigma-54 [Bacteroidales bacterium]MDD3907277.1 RNA polymerase factor sigma-54 [Bacteroidales bacterium]MDD4713069.1 RNA polymerase factor sigma-54 [Bacteroidales bacterium]
MLRQTLTQKLQQKLSPQQIQLVKLLEIPAVELSDRIMQEVDENPALEFGEDPQTMTEGDLPFDEGSEGSNDDFSMEDYAPDDDIPDYRTKDLGSGRSEERRETVLVSSNMSLHDFLQEQLDLQDFDPIQRKVADFIAGSIDNDGYLRRSSEALSDDIAIQLGLEFSISQINKIIGIIQSFDPPGVGAADLQDCLLLQLRRKTQTRLIQETIRLIEDLFDEFSKKHYDSIVRQMGCTMEELKSMIQEIVKLNPRPGSVYGSSIEESMEGITPDFQIDNNDGILQLILNNSNIPELHVSPGYANMVKDYQSNTKNQTRETKQAIQFAKQKVDAARWFIDAVHQRQETLMRTMQAIVDYQYNYFIDGDEKNLKPMILKDIAERTGYDISTISRVSNSKYIQTEFGIFPLKYFFTEAMQTDKGQEVSVLEIKNILQESIDNENKDNPLTDEELCEILANKGYVIARRTIAKYRDQLEIPVARLRREI